MAITRPAAALLRAGLCLALLLTGAAPAAGKDAAAGLGNKNCLSCHDDKQPKIEVTDAKGEKRALGRMNAERYAKSEHGTMECIACHKEIGDSTTPHKKVAGEKAPECIGCHVDLEKRLGSFKTASERRGLHRVVENVEAWRNSYHAKPSKDDPTRVNATCNGCHDVHDFYVPPVGAPARAQWRLGVADRCGTCHDAHLDEWSESVHGRAIKEKRDARSANCADCHSSHAIGRPTQSAVKLVITASCGNCHEEAYKSYRATYHGQIATLGFTETAKCFDCHGSHDVEPPDDEKSKMHVDNRLEACQKCHSPKKGRPLATAGFVSFSPHGTTHDFKRHPQIWVADKIMTSLLVGTFSFFWLHTLLWFFREYKERRLRNGEPRVRLQGLPDVPAQAHGRQFQRFAPIWRGAHLLFALSLMLLTITGISLFYPEAPWAKGLIRLLGGPHTAGIIHRTNAVIFAAVFFWHLFYVGVYLVRNWKTFKVFGPNSLIPGLQDLKDIVAMFKWFLGLAPRPHFDRWTYWEKFDYWAPFWGVTIIGVSGVMLWVAHITAKYLPGWVFNVATIFHGEEAFLAVVFLFTVHFFNNHFRPDKFPLDIVMFTGTVSLEELQREHPLQYRRLVESGELDKHLVAPPSARKVAASKVLGFTLIAIGLMLLTLVGIGFFTSL